jgi:hypothetical protein
VEDIHGDFHIHGIAITIQVDEAEYVVDLHYRRDLTNQTMSFLQLPYVSFDHAPPSRISDVLVDTPDSIEAEQKFYSAKLLEPLQQACGDMCAIG